MPTWAWVHISTLYMYNFIYIQINIEDTSWEYSWFKYIDLGLATQNLATTLQHYISTLFMVFSLDFWDLNQGFVGNIRMNSSLLFKCYKCDVFEVVDGYSTFCILLHANVSKKFSLTHSDTHTPSLTVFLAPSQTHTHAHTHCQPLQTCGLCPDLQCLHASTSKPVPPAIFAQLEAPLPG